VIPGRPTRSQKSPQQSPENAGSQEVCSLGRRRAWRGQPGIRLGGPARDTIPAARHAARRATRPVFPRTATYPRRRRRWPHEIGGAVEGRPEERGVVGEGGSAEPRASRAAHTCYCRSAPASSTTNSLATSAAGTRLQPGPGSHDARGVASPTLSCSPQLMTIGPTVNLLDDLDLCSTTGRKPGPSAPPGLVS